MRSLRTRDKGAPPAVPDAIRPKDLGRRSLDALRVGVLVLDGDDRPTLVNPAAKEMGLLRAGPLGGEPVAHTTVRTLAGQARRTGTRRDLELDLPRGNGGEPLGVHLRAVPLEDEYVCVEGTDVTEAHRVARTRRDFVANVSHELTTPIGSLHLLSSALLEALAAADGTDRDRGAASGAGAGAAGADGTTRGADLAAARRFAESIHREARRMDRLMSELLELSRVQGAEPLPEPEPVPVDRIVAEAVDHTRGAATGKGVDVDTTGARGLAVRGDERQLVSALANLVENAVAYTPEAVPDSPRPRIGIDVVADGDAVEISVRDQGIGIEPGDLDRIFERFYRVDQARSRDAGGSGLGLAIVKHIATNHGGRVRVASTPGEGSIFTLRLPAADGRQRAGEPSGGPDGGKGRCGAG